MGVKAEDLKAELVGNFGLVAGAFRVKSFESVAGSNREEAAGPEKTDERAKRRGQPKA